MLVITCLDYFFALEYGENTTCSLNEYNVAVIDYQNFNAMGACIMHVGVQVNPFDLVSAHLANDIQQRDCDPHVYVRISWCGQMRTITVEDNCDAIMKYLRTTNKAHYPSDKIMSWLIMCPVQRCVLKNTRTIRQGNQAIQEGVQLTGQKTLGQTHQQANVRYCFGSTAAC